ncbi:hypothetical protein ACKF11_12760 [Methylobacillus sp. Pita2]|uniref:hypothetical protein n=1 Tax=Methylobacillus sp. Pita2 TaxID=3383245 RepID=UPI0038B49E96
MTAQYILDGLNKLDAQLREKGRITSTELMKFMERRTITSVIAKGIQPTKENLEREFDTQAQKYGHAILYYRDMGKQRSEIIVNTAMQNLRVQEQRIVQLQEEELEMNLQRLGERDKEAKITFLAMAKTIDEVQDLMAFTETGDVGQLATKAAFDKLVGGSPIIEYTKMLAQRPHLVKGALELAGANQLTGMAKLAVKKATFGTVGGL